VVVGSTGELPALRRGSPRVQPRGPHEPRFGGTADPEVVGRNAAGRGKGGCGPMVAGLQFDDFLSTASLRTPATSAAGGVDVETEFAEAPVRNTLEPVRLRRRSTDAAMLHLVREVLDESWSPQVAAHRLLDLVGGDLRVLHRARARVLQAAMERSTAITERALVTLELARRAGSL
jgi:hypothetical protein